MVDPRVKTIFDYRLETWKPKKRIGEAHMKHSGFDLEAAGGLPDEALFELLNLAKGPALGARPVVTPKGVARIEYELGLKLPWTMVAIAMHVPRYYGMFCVIDGDENSYMHILGGNRNVRSNPVWPKGLVALAHWGDGVSLCWDAKGEKDAENLPVLWCQWSEKWNFEKDVMEEEFEIINEYAVNFRQFAERYAVYHATHHPQRSGRKKAQKILDGVRLSK